MFVRTISVGWAILIVAIILNGIATRVGLYTWYAFILDTMSMGFVPAFRQLPLVSKAFLFVIYPLLLGVTACYTMEKLT